MVTRAKMCAFKFIECLINISMDTHGQQTWHSTLNILRMLSERVPPQLSCCYLRLLLVRLCSEKKGDVESHRDCSDDVHKLEEAKQVLPRVTQMLNAARLGRLKMQERMKHWGGNLQQRHASVMDNAISSTVKSTMLIDMIKSVQTSCGPKESEPKLKL